MSLIAPTIYGIRVVSVGSITYAGVPLDGDVRVLEDVTLVRTREGTIHRLVERDGQVREAPLSNVEYDHVLGLFGVES
ncbi:hypothetical protein [Microbacterium caowuchunii]|uniref:Uncharacterized protein n=1 Tax=Microbacterium caowuchunii TaxID=2614638 RepID=A0A5N0T812_9MICO|nr:hypothetical protein [Microbacterium caowuchunii]KAA9131163.1 hypothetical protein F6B40_12750 [Microbacterium caowuchunii]